MQWEQPHEQWLLSRNNWIGSRLVISSSSFNSIAEDFSHQNKVSYDVRLSQEYNKLPLKLVRNVFRFIFLSSIKMTICFIRQSFEFYTYYRFNSSLSTSDYSDYVSSTDDYSHYAIMLLLNIKTILYSI